MSSPLTAREVAHVARLARLRISDEQAERCRGQLASVLEHIAKLQAVDVSDVEPMVHAFESTNRLDEDTPAAPMPVEALLRNAPAAEGPYLAVPKVLADGGGA